jgi:hypothetical protein
VDNASRRNAVTICGLAWRPSPQIELKLELAMDLDPSQYGEADRRGVDPPVEVQVASWSSAGTLNWWVKEQQQC